MVGTTTTDTKKYTLDFLIKKNALFNNRKIKDIISDLQKCLNVSDRKIYYLKQATKKQTSKDYTMTPEQRQIIAKYFGVAPSELDAR